MRIWELWWSESKEKTFNSGVRDRRLSGYCGFWWRGSFLNWYGAFTVWGPGKCREDPRLLLWNRLATSGSITRIGFVTVHPIMNYNTNHFELRAISQPIFNNGTPARIRLHSARRFGSSPRLRVNNHQLQTFQTYQRRKNHRTKAPGNYTYTGGDWNAVRDDGVVHLYARYTIQASDGTIIGICNEGYGRAGPETMKTVLEDMDPSKASMTNVGADWYTRTSPRFEVAAHEDSYYWLTSSVFLGDLKPPQRPG